MNRRGFAGLFIIGIIALIAGVGIRDYFVRGKTVPAYGLNSPVGTSFTLVTGERAIVGDFWGVTLNAVDVSQHTAHISIQRCAAGCLFNPYPLTTKHMTLRLDKSQLLDAHSFSLIALSQTSAALVVRAASTTQATTTPFTR